MRNIFKLFFILTTYVVNAQVLSTGNWNSNNTKLSIVYTSENNGDGTGANGDDSIFVKTLSTTADQGATFTFDGVMTLNESITISTYNYNTNNSYVRFNVQLYNLTDGVVLATTSPYISIVGVPQNPSPVQTTLNHTASASDVGDVLQVRYVRISPFDTFRNFKIDNLSLNGSFVSLNLSTTCPFTVTPDLPLLSSNATIENEITGAVNSFSNSYLGTSAPSASALASAETAYAAMGINVSGGVITGNPTNSFSDASFLRTFAQHLKFNSGDTNIQEKASNTVWWVSKQFCAGTIALDGNGYTYEDFARPASLLKDFLTTAVQDLFAFTLYEHTKQFQHFWVTNYDDAHIAANDAINTDAIYNLSDVLLAYSVWHDTADERYRYMTAYKRYMNRFFTYSPGTSNGLKEDGSGFHHWTAYNNYMYAYKTAASIVSYLSGTRFQVDQSNYKTFRAAVYAQYMQSNDNGVQALSTSGRKPDSRSLTFSQSSLKALAIAGGDILGIATADPILAGMYNRIYGVDSEFNYNALSPFTEGFFQFNHASASAFRKNSWLAFNKGFTNNMWGAEIYPTNNRYGRYQSYGALELIYSGDKETGNGYEVDTWNWNYNPGATVIRLPWENLRAERGRIDELQQKRFAGALNLKNKNSELLTNIHGDYGMFAMDFQELEGQGFSTTYTSEKHNDSFTFKKSNFFFDDIIVCLASGISNNDALNETITTLYQRIDNKGVSPNVNGVSQSSSGEVSFTGASNNWLLSNYNTGFYLLSGNHSLKVKKELQQTPNYNQVWPVDYSNNATETYYTGYIDHGTSPSNKGYEYVLKPDSNVTEMQTLHADIQAGNKPYTVHQKNADAHIVEHESKKIFGYAFFNSASNLTYDFVTDVNASCLVMTEYDSNNQNLLVSITNPDIGFESRSYAPSINVTRQVTFAGEWALSTTYSGVQIISSNAAETVIEFSLVDGLAKEVLLNEIISTGCTYQTIDFNNFESGWGIWNDGGSDSRRSANDSNYALGTYCARLRDNTSTSVITTDNLDLSNYEEVTIDFSYYARSMDNSNEDFWLQISTNGGTSYTTVEEWNRGDEFNNNERKYDQVVLPGSFTTNTRIRFRCDASGNKDWVYLDDITISGCTSTASRKGISGQNVLEVNNNQISTEAPSQNDLETRIYPNPARDFITVELLDSTKAVEDMKIIDLNGRTVFRVKTSNQSVYTIDVSSLKSGVYFITTVVKGSNEVLNKKIIIK